ncbi:GumC family protein, partial [Methylobacterium trifolii]|uniref:GumC family protein n=1 Tax=Methylobacterium trifolii TaxID=1003092 RepID=UPI001EE04646
MSYLEQDLVPAAYAEPAAAPPLTSVIRGALGVLRRCWRPIAIGAVSGLVLAAAVAYSLTPLYRAAAEISIDPRRLSVLDTKDERKRQEPVFDGARVDSLIESARSDKTVRAVVADLHLDEDPEFNGTRPTLLSRVLGWLPGSETEEPSQADRQTAAVEAVGGAFSAARTEGTFVFEARFLSESPVKAAVVANAFAAAFLRDQVQSNSETSQQAAAWLKNRLTELSAQAGKADGAVVAFKREHNIAIADGKSIDELALTAIGAMLTDAAGATATAQAKLDRVTAVAAQGTPDLAVADMISNEVITKLRQQYFDNNQRIADLASRFGEDHPLVKRLRADGVSTLASVRSELQRIEQVYRSDLEIARQREATLRANLAEQMRKTSDIGANQVKLQELESIARTTRKAYEDYSQRYIQAVQQQSFPVSEARQIAEATPPTKKFSPKRTLLMALGFVGGGL